MIKTFLLQKLRNLFIQKYRGSPLKNDSVKEAILKKRTGCNKPLQYTIQILEH